MPHTVHEGKGMITVKLDDGSGDYITPDKFTITNIYWLNVNATDKLILREYDPDKAKSEMPYIPLLNTVISTNGLLPPKISIRYLIDYAASTTPTNNVVVFMGTWC